MAGRGHTCMDFGSAADLQFLISCCCVFSVWKLTAYTRFMYFSLSKLCCNKKFTQKVINIKWDTTVHPFKNLKYLKFHLQLVQIYISTITLRCLAKSINLNIHPTIPSMYVTKRNVYIWVLRSHGQECSQNYYPKLNTIQCLSMMPESKVSYSSELQGS